MVLITLTATSGYSCQPLSPNLESATLTLTATSLGQGEFELAGTTNLAENTQLTALALRYLDPTQPIGGEAEPTYSILAYQPVTVKDGQWQTQLDLWQASEQGRYREAWQSQNEDLKLIAQPQDSVQFVVIMAPRHLLRAGLTNLTQSSPQAPASLVRTTADGEPFLWVDQTEVVALPTGQTTPNPALARRNGGWGERYLLVPEPPLPYTLKPEDKRQTNAPPTPGEFLR